MAQVTSSKINKNWKVAFSDDLIEQNDFLYVVNDLLDEFTKFIPIDSKRLMMIHRWSAGYPLYSFDKINIFLDVAGATYWAQIVYQLSHELCHYSIETGIQSSNLKWFEEVLCDLVSHFFLIKMRDRWASSSDPLKNRYSQNFFSYHSNAISKTKKIELRELSNNNSNISIYLSEQAIDRKINTYVAKKLLTIVIKESDILGDIPKIKNVKNNLTINEFLKEWASLSQNSNAHIFNKIIHQFE